MAKYNKKFPISRLCAGHSHTFVWLYRDLIWIIRYKKKYVHPYLSHFGPHPQPPKKYTNPTSFYILLQRVRIMNKTLPVTWTGVSTFRFNLGLFSVKYYNLYFWSFSGGATVKSFPVSYVSLASCLNHTFARSLQIKRFIPFWIPRGGRFGFFQPLTDVSFFALNKNMSLIWKLPWRLYALSITRPFTRIIGEESRRFGARIGRRGRCAVSRLWLH